MYDKGGNRVSEKIYEYTLSEALGTVIKEVKSEYNYIVWNDRLSKYDGKTVTYDAVGNPTKYDGKTFEWEGKQLKSITAGDGSKTEYEYDSNGLRVMKKQYDEEGKLSYYVEYLWQDGKITTQYITLISYSIKNGVVTNTISIGPFSSKIFYDESGAPQGFSFLGETIFTFVRNLQGDVIAVVDSEGNTVMEYSYDPWGNLEYHLVNEELANNEETAMLFTALCPLTYRGYNYDFTTGLYYLQSRYYNPEWGRFINCDDTNILLATQGEDHGANLFAYCDNNPVNRVDYKGRNSNKLVVGIALTLLVLSALERVHKTYEEIGEIYFYSSYYDIKQHKEIKNLFVNDWNYSIASSGDACYIKIQMELAMNPMVRFCEYYIEIRDNTNWEIIENYGEKIGKQYFSIVNSEMFFVTDWVLGDMFPTLAAVSALRIFAESSFMNHKRAKYINYEKNKQSKIYEDNYTALLNKYCTYNKKKVGVKFINVNYKEHDCVKEYSKVNPSK